MQTYQNTKPTDIAWLGEVPEHWELRKAKYLFSKMERAVRSDDEIVTCFRSGEVTLRSNRRTEGFTNALKEHGYQGVRKGDLVIHAMDAFAGAIGVSDTDGKSTPVYSVCTPRLNNQVNVYFYAYFLRNLALSGFIQSLAKGIRERSTDFRFSDFAQLELPLPPLLEQTAIANFLDKKTAQIKEAIDLKSEQIDKLKEYRQTLINQTVTQGLNHNALMKNSGVEWLGEVPSHWEVRRFRHLFSFRKGLAITKENLQDTGIPCVNYGEIHSKFGFSVNPEFDELKCVSEGYLKHNQKSLINYGDFVFADTSEDIEGSGNFTYLNSNKVTFAGYHTIICSSKKNCHSRFLAYIFDSLVFRNQIRQKVKGVKVFSITQNVLKDNLVWLPPKNEQTAIADFLDKKTTQIDTAIRQYQAEIDKLKEYQQSLVNEVVTGKVRVKQD